MSLRILLCLVRTAVALVFLILVLLLALPIGFYGMALYIEPSLPDVDKLQTMQLEMPLQIYTADNLLIGQYGNRLSLPINYQDLPKQLEQAILAAEDANFFEHSGISVTGLGRAITQMATGAKDQTGGSTITQQVAKNYFLSAEQTLERKLIEMYLARRIENELTKDEIMALYVNKIYLGQGAYGIKAGAKRYYSKSLENLTLAESAMLAGLPKAPSDFNPVNNPKRSLIRRNWILGRMLEQGFISQAEHDEAVAEGINLHLYQATTDEDLPYVSEAARAVLTEQFGEQVMTSGWRVKLTIDSKTQLAAEKAVKDGLKNYTRSYGVSGAGIEAVSGDLANFDVYDDLLPAKVVAIHGNAIDATLKNGQIITLNKPYGVEVGNIIRLAQKNDTYTFVKAPKVQGALLSMNPKNGALIAVVGGYDFHQSKFNRALQGYRQPGSTIKPLVYASLLEYKDVSPEYTISNEPHLRNWPKNAGQSGYGGISTLRGALSASYNTTAVNVLKEAGIETTRDLMHSMGLYKKNTPDTLSLALGALEATPLQMATAYSSFINGGHRVNPYIIEQIYDFDGNIVYNANPVQSCAECYNANLTQLNENAHNQFINNAKDAKAADIYDATAKYDRLHPKQAPVFLPADQAPKVISPKTAYHMASMLQSVITSGTGRGARALGRSDIGGKTGTTNHAKDVWFSGINPNITTVVWMGFDTPKSLGAREFGGTRALPIWNAFMRYALASRPVEWIDIDGKPQNSAPTPIEIMPIKPIIKTPSEAEADGDIPNNAASDTASIQDSAAHD